MRELDGRVALVTGAARNIGRAIALDLADAVAVVTRADRNGAEAVVREIEQRGGAALALLADVKDEADVASAVERTLARFGRLDILVNNAAVRGEVAFETMQLAQWREVVAVTLDGAFLCSRAALEPLSRGGSGTIVNIGGLTAYTGARNRAHVVAAKAGLDGLTKALAQDLAPRGITVNLVSPGLIDTVRGGGLIARRARASSASRNAHRAARTPRGGRRPGALSRGGAGALHHGADAARQRRCVPAVSVAREERAQGRHPPCFSWSPDRLQCATSSFRWL